MNGSSRQSWWESLRHFGLLLSPAEVARLELEYAVGPLPFYRIEQLRREKNRLEAGQSKAGEFVSSVLENVCGFRPEINGVWKRAAAVPGEWSRVLVSGEMLKPRHLWKGIGGGRLPVFIDKTPRLGIGRGRKPVSDVAQWLRLARLPAALITNARQWRLLHAGLDYDCGCEWEIDLWFEEGEPGPQLEALRRLLQPTLHDRGKEGEEAPLAAAIAASRRGQSELSALLGERVREAVERLVRAHGEALHGASLKNNGAEIYRAAVRMIMRLVVILFAESRDLLPRSDPIYHGAYGLEGLFEHLQRAAARGRARLEHRFGAWPRILALCRLIYEGSYHEALQVPAYGGDLFAPGEPDSSDPASRALHVFETACFDSRLDLMPDAVAHHILELLTRTRVKVRQGRAGTTTMMPVDFADLSSEYIGILYEGLLEYELRTAPEEGPIIFLAIGKEPALPLSRLEGMDDRQIRDLLEKLKDAPGKEVEDAAGESDGLDEAGDNGDKTTDLENEAAEAENPESEAEEMGAPTGEGEAAGPPAETARRRAMAWTRKACLRGGLAPKPRSGETPEKRLLFERKLEAKARQLVRRVVLPGEWYLVRWGGTRKGSGTFYTRPQLVAPTVHRTLRPLAFNPPADAKGEPDRRAPPQEWLPKKPEEILALKVCDPACGSGSFPVAALRFLTEALYASLFAHQRLARELDRTMVQILGTRDDGGEERLADERIPCRPDDPLFEPRLKARLRRYVVEHCIYGVDLDPLAVELCRLSLWIETMDRDLPFSFLDHKIKCGNSLVGCWFDRFAHYPAMAWKNREGGDKTHANGVHYEKETRTRAIKAFVKDRLQADLRHFLEGPTLFDEDRRKGAHEVHDDALRTFEALHSMPVQDAAERAERYRALIAGDAWQTLKRAFDLWCACWFWPADELEDAPLPSTLASPPGKTLEIAEKIAAAKRFFHWELEFPDVFNRAGSGFDAIVGNPPWDTLQPVSKEYFSNLDPLFRTYGKQEALRKETEYFNDAFIEKNWLSYNAGFKDSTNWMKHSAFPFGDPEQSEKSVNRFNVARGKFNLQLHARWQSQRENSKGYADRAHPFRHQGQGKPYTYKLFLEQTHEVLKKGGRLGFVVPSGLYSDHGTGALRDLFLDHCRWEWLFGFENREKIFDIHRSFKFNPVIIRKGGQTEAIRAAFMRRKLEDWEEAENFATDYPRKQVTRFSPKSKALLEIQSQRDLEILEKIYANSVLLGDDGPDGWGIKYAQGDFNMTSDSKLFPPRPQWEAKGYRPDEYSRWLLGPWRPIGDLYKKLGADPNRPIPLDPACEAEIRARSHEVQSTPFALRCAQPPYDTLPIPRADLPEGIILSRDASQWIAEDEIEDTALPLYQGAMIWHYDFCFNGHESGAGNRVAWSTVDWAHKVLKPQFLIRVHDFVACGPSTIRLAFRDISNATNQRSFIAAIIPNLPAGNKTPILEMRTTQAKVVLSAVLSSFTFDFATRNRMTSTSLNFFIVEELPTCSPNELDDSLIGEILPLSCASQIFAPTWLKFLDDVDIFRQWSVTTAARLRRKVILDCIIAQGYGLNEQDICWFLQSSDLPESGVLPKNAFQLNPKGFWRIDKEKDPELRQTVLTLVAFHDLEEKIAECGGDRERGIEAFCNQNSGEGWMIPETLRLADYGLGHDARAKEHQPVASRLGPRFYDWQLAQTPAESWRECHLHARNLLGEPAYQRLLREIETGEREEPLKVAEPNMNYNPGSDPPQQEFTF